MCADCDPFTNCESNCNRNSDCDCNTVANAVTYTVTVSEPDTLTDAIRSAYFPAEPD